MKRISSILRQQLQYFAGRLSEREMLAAFDTTVPGCSFADITDAADYIQRTVRPHERVLVWTRAVQINFLAKRRSPTRFIHYSMLRLAYEPFPFAKPWAQELEDAFERQPPEVIVLPGPKTGPDYQELWNEPIRRQGCACCYANSRAAMSARPRLARSRSIGCVMVRPFPASEFLSRVAGPQEPSVRNPNALPIDLRQADASGDGLP